MYDCCCTKTDRNGLCIGTSAYIHDFVPIDVDDGLLFALVRFFANLYLYFGFFVLVFLLLLL